MSKLVWDKAGEKLFETGVSKCILFEVYSGGTQGIDPDEVYGISGVAWNGITGVTESPSGAEDTDFYADNIKYGSMKSAEKFDGTIKAYMYPDQWEVHDGSATLATGVKAGQQARTPFGLVYRTEIGNDVDGDAHGYKLHFIYGASAKPSSKDYATINDSPSAIEFSWEFSTTPVNITIENTTLKATSYVTVDSTKADATKLASLEAMIYGGDNTDPQMPTPAKIAGLLT